jgi:predicted enzyme related to lactoylglutathione lyase
MSKIESYTPGSFCWAELSTSDPAAAKIFYGEMFGWAAVDNPMPQGVYTLFQVEGLDAAATVQAPPGVPVHWGVYFAVASVDQTVALVVPAGGKVIAGPFDAHDFGRMAVVQDPQGAVFSIWEAKKSIGATYGGPLNQVVWPELSTPDPTAAAAFYHTLFGWGTKPESGLDTAMYTEWQQAGKSIGGMLAQRGDEWKGIPPYWLVYVTVADCDERAAKAVALGGKLRVPPHDIPDTGRFSMIVDPQGATISIIKLTRPM